MIDNVINIGDIVFLQDGMIDGITNENYGHLFRCINVYYASLLIDINLQKPIGYFYYNEHSYDVCNDKIFKKQMDVIKRRTIEEVYYLATLILLGSSGYDILDIFYSNTSEQYRAVEDELRIYIDLIYSIFQKRVDY